MRHLVLLGILLGVAEAAPTPNSAVTPQTPQLQAIEIISATGACTASGQPFACCTGAGTGSGCNTTAASTDAAPVWTTVYTGNANGSKIVGIWVTSTDATAHVVTCSVNKGGTTRPGSVAVTTGTVKPGFTTSNGAVNVLVQANWPGLPIDSDGNPFVFLSNASDKIECRYATALTAGTLLGITVIGEDF